jgi:hypothetical protein
MALHVGLPVVGMLRLFAVAVSVAALLGCAVAEESAVEVPAGSRSATRGGVIATTAADRAPDRIGDSGDGDVAVLYETDTEDTATGDTVAAVLYGADDTDDADTDDADTDDADTDDADTDDTDQIGRSDSGTPAGAEGDGAFDGAGTDSAVADSGSGDAGDAVETSGVRFVVDDVGGVLVEGVCGWSGPVCPVDESVEPIDQGGRLVFRERSQWEPWVGRVLDMCNDHEALVALFGERWNRPDEWGPDIGPYDRIDYLAPISPYRMQQVIDERQRHPIVCSDAEVAIPEWKCWDGDIVEFRAYMDGFEEAPGYSEVAAWVESSGLDCFDATAQRYRYVYVTRDGPLLPKGSVEAAVDDFVGRVAIVNTAKSDFGGNEPLGYRGWRYPIESPADKLVVLPKTVTVIDGVLRGLAQNHSERLWARDVTVTATDPKGGAGESRFPLAVQPGETIPFEIENWTGSQDPTEISIVASADLSPRIDLGRSLQFHQYVYSIDNVDLPYLKENYFRQNYPAEMLALVEGKDTLPTPDDFDEWINTNYGWVIMEIGYAASAGHPLLAAAGGQQSIENLTVYVAIMNEDGVEDVVEPTPMQRAASSSGGREWREARTLQLPDYPNPPDSVYVAMFAFRPFNIWAGGTLREVQPPGDESR